jgi:hypothetical protein
MTTERTGAGPRGAEISPQTPPPFLSAFPGLISGAHPTLPPDCQRRTGPRFFSSLLELL